MLYFLIPSWILLGVFLIAAGIIIACPDSLLNRPPGSNGARLHRHLRTTMWLLLIAVRSMNASDPLAQAIQAERFKERERERLWRYVAMVAGCPSNRNTS